MGYFSRNLHTRLWKPPNGFGQQHSPDEEISKKKCTHPDSAKSAQVENKASVLPLSLVSPPTPTSSVIPLVTTGTLKCRFQNVLDRQNSRDIERSQIKNRRHQSLSKVKATLSEAFHWCNQAIINPERVIQERDQAREERDLALYACNEAVKRRDNAREQRDKARREGKENHRLYVKACHKHSETLLQLTRLTQERDEAIRKWSIADEECRMLRSELETLQKRNEALEKKCEASQLELRTAQSHLLDYKKEVESTKRQHS